MESEKSIISSEAKLSAIAGVMFFAPFVKYGIKSEEFSEDEKNFIYGYTQVGFLNLIFLLLILLAALVNFFEFNEISTWIIKIGSLAIYIVSVFSIFACANDLGMRGPDESINQKIPYKGQVLKAYTPLVNFIFWFRQENYSMPYWWLKESILLRTIFIFGTLLLGNGFGIGMLVIILIRVILLMLNIDIIPISIKKAINVLFFCNPGEMFAYIFAPIVSKIKKADYQTVLQTRKQQYIQGQTFGIGIMLQYVLFIGILFLLYRGINISLYNATIFIAVMLWVLRVIIFYKDKGTFLRIPVISEITSLVFH